MITLTAAQQSAARHDSIGHALIVKIESPNGPGPWWMADRPIMLKDDQIAVQGWLLNEPTIDSGVDVASHRYASGRVMLTIKGTGVERRSDGYDNRFTDVLGNELVLQTIIGATVTIYWFHGREAMGTADLVQLFRGIVTDFDLQSDESLLLYADQESALNHKPIPKDFSTIAGFPQLKDAADPRPLPFVYGSFQEGTSIPWEGFVPLMQIGANEFLVANHPVAALHALWRYIESLDAWALFYAGVTLTADWTAPDGVHRSRAVIDPDTMKAYVFIRPTSAIPTQTATDATNLQDPSAAWDQDPGTSYSLMADSATTASIIFQFEQEGVPEESAIDNSLAVIDADTLHVFENYITRPGGITWTTAVVEIWDGVAWVAFGATIASGTNLQAHNFSPTYLWTGAKGIFWHLGRGPKGALGSASKPTRVRVRFTGSGWTANTTVVANIFEVRLRIYATHQKIVNTTKAIRRGSSVRTAPTKQKTRVRVTDGETPEPNERTDLFAEVEGKMWGSWIDAGGRSNSHNAGAMIGHPAGMVEDFLRAQLIQTDLTIDVASFDVMYNDGVARRAHYWSPLGAQMGSQEWLDMFMVEHGMYYEIDHLGRFRIFRFSGTGTTVATLTPDDLTVRIPRHRSTDYREMIEFLRVRYALMSHDNTLARQATFTDTSANGGYQTQRDDTIELKTVFDPSYLGDIRRKLIYVSGSDEALRSRPHVLVTLPTKGRRFIHAQLGDSFLLDETKFAPIIRSIGLTWASRPLMIHRKRVTPEGITFECIDWQPRVL